MKSARLIMLFLLSSSVLWANEMISGKVVTVIDGNTLEVYASDNETYKILLYGVDSPELTQEYGDKAKRALEKMILDRSVSIEIQGKDRWGNRLGIVLIDGEDPREKLLEEGLAWTSEKNPMEQFELIRVKAQEKGKGLWKETDPTPPWTYRRQQTMTQYKTS